MPIDPVHDPADGKITPLTVAVGSLAEGMKKTEDRVPPEDSKAIVSTFTFPLELFLKFPGASIVKRGIEAIFIWLVGKTPKGIVEFIAIVFVYFSPLWIFALWRYGFIESVWSGALDFSARILLR